MVLSGIIRLLGGIALFLTGLESIKNCGVIGDKGNNFARFIKKSRLNAMLTGAAASGILQSSSAVNMLAVSFTEANIIPLISAFAIIIGTNIGTTVTAQIVALSQSSEINGFDFGLVVLFIGFILKFIKKANFKPLCKIFLGIGLMFTGLKIMTDAVTIFYDKPWFINFFLIKSPPISLLNGFFITAICQSSTVVTSLLCILTASDLVSVDKAIYMILGANIGSCMSVIITSYGLNVKAKQAAYFNLIFNIAGALVFFIIMLFLSTPICDFLIRISAENSRALANFHTLFNLISAIIFLPFLGFFEKLINKLIPDKRVLISKKKDFSAKKPI